MSMATPDSQTAQSTQSTQSAESTTAASDSPATQPRSLKERQRDERERLILQEGEALLVEKGYGETSMDEIATRVGVSKGTLYLHFASKEDLVLAIIEKNLRVFTDSMRALSSSSLS